MKPFFTLSFLFACLFTFAQESKVGTIDIEFILSKMPETTGVLKQVETYSKGLEQQFEDKLKKLQADVEAYKIEQAGLTINQRKAKEDSLIAFEEDVNLFQQNGNKLILLKRDELLQPLYTKIGTALEKVAQAEGYTQVLLRDDRLVFIDNRLDLTLKVLKELGIEIKEEEVKN